MAVGDLVLAWQTDKRMAVGLCRVHALEDWVDEDGTPQRDLILNLLGEPFSPAYSYSRSPNGNAALASVRAFSPGFPSTLYSTSPLRSSIADEDMWPTKCVE